jgi:hypothetical protein
MVTRWDRHRVSSDGRRIHPGIWRVYGRALRPEWAGTGQQTNESAENAFRHGCASLQISLTKISRISSAVRGAAAASMWPKCSGARMRTDQLKRGGGPCWKRER